MVNVKIRKLFWDAVVPSYAHEGDAGLDFYSSKDYVIGPGKREIISTGISMEIPLGYVALVWDKSGLAAKKGITIFGGVIDSHYRGEYKIIVYNSGDEDFEIHQGDRVAQVLIQKIELAEITIVEELSETPRGGDGFGSTGV